MGKAVKYEHLLVKKKTSQTFTAAFIYSNTTAIVAIDKYGKSIESIVNEVISL